MNNEERINALLLVIECNLRTLNHDHYFQNYDLIRLRDNYYMELKHNYVDLK